MSSTISKEFVDKKLSTLPIVPSEWDVGRGHYYQLDLRMCQIQRIKWGFNWGDESKPLPRIATITEQPSRILKADFSLNELQNLDYEALYPLKHLRVLDASLNRIQRFESIEVLSHLQTLNLSHNFIKRLDGLERSYNLTELNLGMNEIEDISMMPTLTNLTVLYLNNNKLKSLDGVQGLARLRELYVQRNQIVDLVPLLSSRNLIILNAADNHISALQTTGEVLRHLHKLQSITLHGNPIERENLYQAAILDASQVMVLDNISVRNPPRIEVVKQGLVDVTNVNVHEKTMFGDWRGSGKKRSTLAIDGNWRYIYVYIQTGPLSEKVVKQGLVDVTNVNVHEKTMFVARRGSGKKRSTLAIDGNWRYIYVYIQTGPLREKVVKQGLVDVTNVNVHEKTVFVAWRGSGKKRSTLAIDGNWRYIYIRVYPNWPSP
ncbi:leucine-rich repeat-containing protein 9-like [Lingula anatina]|uniref:Leucine-rich repeat-containing protein 9-like n=1 Tax=Lingula anatina TaxID=7574 RepID=A0A1S3JIR1_LINAN|nr:leucine-rich repeat-containing protein 9-like [Lingula anatina]|eukprot:XP_013410300.1 leucine-rich repeat-containing protein 9-like [Lingula anatina]